MPTATDYTAAVREIVPDLEYSAEFVPQSKSRNAGDKHPSLNWRVTLGRAGRTLTTDYMQGIGHLPKTEKAFNPRSVEGDKAIRRAAEQGTFARHDGYVTSRNPIPAPELADVLHSLLLDAEAINSGSFEDWAGDFGYDTDSRKAEAIYRACLDTGLKLRAMLGDETIQRLREALRDM